MPVKLKLGPNARKGGFLGSAFRLLIIAVLFVVLVGAGVFFYYYNQYQQLVDERLAAGPLFASVAQIYAAPQEVRVGQHLAVPAIAAELKSAGYNTNPQLGTYDLRENAILVKPGPQSYLATDGATITTSDGEVVAITAENGVALQGYKLEPQLITALSEDKNRTKRRLVKYDEIPPRMVQAVVAIEDRKFFEHGGINYVRMVKCVAYRTSSRARRSAAARP